MTEANEWGINMAFHIRSRFTLIEILVVITVIAVLAAMLLPSLARARDRAYGTTCLSNMRQLNFGYIEYVEDNDHWFPNANTGNPSRGTPYWTDRGNSEAAIERGVIYPYMTTTAIYACPSDWRYNAPKRIFETFWRAFSVNGYLHGERNKASGIHRVTRSPDEVMTITEEQDPRGFNVNSFFLGTPTAITWRNGDWLAAIHLQGYNIAFADGHIEYRKCARYESVIAGQVAGFAVSADNPDYHAMLDNHSPLRDWSP